MEKKEYLSECLNGSDFSEQDLTNVIFKKCKFKNVRFKNTILKNAQFISCDKIENLSFENADMTGCTIHLCKFPDSIFKNTNLSNSSIKGSDFSSSSLLGTRFNGSIIDGLDISKCNLNMASFLDTQIGTINYLPTRPLPYFRGIRIFHSNYLIRNSIFINGNQHLEFTEYCNSELRKDRFFASANRQKGPIRIMAIILLVLFGILTDFGQSFGRWFTCVICILGACTLIPLYTYGLQIGDAIQNSILAFFGFGEINIGYNAFYVTESAIGYFMLGILISLITTKLSIN